MQIQVGFDDGGLGHALQELFRRSLNLKPVFDEVGSMLETAAEDRIESEGPGPENQKWPPLAASTRARRGSSAKMLRDHGHLYQSLTYSASRLDVAIGSNKVYAAIQQLGGKAGRGHKVTIPARPYLGVSEDDEKHVGELLTKYLTEGIQ